MTSEWVLRKKVVCVSGSKEGMVEEEGGGISDRHVVDISSHTPGLSTTKFVVAGSGSAC